MFASTNFNQPLNNWNVSSVTNMRGMFEGAIAFNQPIETWDVSAVTDMSFMFILAQNFNQPLNNWNVSAVTQMPRMFERASSFNRRLGSWNVSNVTNMSGMFDRATSYNQPMDNWNVSNVTNMSNMFSGATSFDQSLGTWDVSNVNNMTNMFLNVTLSTINYDDTLIAWDALNLQPNVNFHGGFSQYCNSASQRTNIINNDGWTIIDGGQTICGSLSAKDFENQAFKLYPNPTKTSFYIETKEIVNNVGVIDILGKTVKTFKSNVENYSIDDLKSGLYFININTEKGKATKKLIKE
jgi:surface protein